MKAQTCYAIVERYKKKRFVRGYNYDRRDKGVCRFGGVPYLFESEAYALTYCRMHRISLVQYKIVCVEVREKEFEE
jgi:hypothetical protein